MDIDALPPWTSRGEVAVLAWSVRCVLCYESGTKPKRPRVNASLECHVTYTTGKTYVVYRRQMLRLLAWPKPAFDQLAIELPCLMGFRAREVCTWRAEHIDWRGGDTLVMDAKRHELMTVPMCAAVHKHAEQVLGSRGEGYVLQSRSTAWQRTDRPLSTTAIWYIWAKWTHEAGLPNADDISPVVGRRFFACEWVYAQGLPVATLSRILRHSSPETTWRYVQSLIFHEDVKRDYDRFQLRLMRDLAESRRQAQGVKA